MKGMSTMSSSSLISPNDNNLSLEARGVLAIMLNDPECDYCTFRGLENRIHDKCLKSALQQLFDQNYICEHDKLIMVNKRKILKMQLIGGGLMPIMKKSVKTDFTVVHNHFLRNPNLSIAARGLLLTMISLPDNWNFSVKGLASLLPDGECKVSTAIKELERNNYLIRNRLVDNKGKVTDWEYLISDEPFAQNSSNDKNDCPQCENPDVDNPDVDSSHLENRSVYKINNNKINNNKELYNQSIDDEKSKEYEKKVIAIFGIKSKISKKQQVTIQKWEQMNFSEELLTIAYERCVDYIGNLNFNYINTILTDWSSKKISTPEQIAKLDFKFKASKKSNKSSGAANKETSYDLKNFEKYANDMSYLDNMDI